MFRQPFSKMKKNKFPLQKVASKKLKVALVHDYLREYGGAERVVEALHDLFPEAPLYVAFTDPKALGIHWEKFKNWDIRQSWLTRIPFYRRFYSPLRIWAPQYFQAFDLSEYDLVISSSNAYMAKAIQVRPDATHICYCHTPPRSLYGYTTMSDWRKNPLTHLVGTLINHYLRIVDVRVAQQVGYFIANSAETAARIKKFYRRDSTIIYPPVVVPDQPPTQQTRDYYLYVNRLALAKHPEIAVRACTQLKVPLKVVGTGKMLADLKAIAGPTVEFLGAVDDAMLHQLYAGAKALLYPVEDEDFGIVPVEAMAHGVPVIAHESGGPKETVIEEKTGLFFQELSVNGLIEAMLLAKGYQFDSKILYKQAQQFTVESFQMRITQFIQKIRNPNNE